jgi:plastocyanin
MSGRSSRESLLLPVLIPVGALVAIVVVLYGFSRILLSLKPNAATATALVAAVAVLGVATFVATRTHVTSAALGAFVGATAGIAMLAGGLAIAVIGPSEPEIAPFHAEIAAPEGAIQEGFSTDVLKVEPDKPIELTFENDDPGVGHNIQIFDGPDAGAPSLFDGQPVTGPDSIPYEIPPLQEGEYFFHCRLHPNTAMEGTITVEKGAGGVRLVAQNVRFDTDRIEIPANTPTPLTLDNEDPAAHNVAIFEGDAAQGEPLFRFEPFTGPATQTHTVDPLPPGEYFFHCEVHPTMEGTVVVTAEGGGGGGGGGGDGGGGDGGGGDGGGGG